jgi:hypothetical protein
MPRAVWSHRDFGIFNVATATLDFISNMLFFVMAIAWLLQGKDHEHNNNGAPIGSLAPRLV